jgi:triacylglycerol lipase
MTEVSVGLCVIVIILILVLLVGGILIAFFILYSRLQAESEEAVRAFCTDVGGYLPYNTKLTNPITDEYSKDVANFLLTTNLNVTIANCSQFTEQLPLPPDFNRKIPLTQTFGNTKRNIGFIFYSESLKTILVSFTGTFFFEQWESDLVFLQTSPTQLNNFNPGILIHQGFYNIYLSVRSQLENNLNMFPEATQLIISGHSLGGALATIAAFDFAKNDPKPIVYTFASPRVGNIDFAKKYGTLDITTQRVFNTEDVVPCLPPPVLQDFVYDHVGNGIDFTNNLGDLTKNHIQAYEQFVGINTSPLIIR